MRRSGCPMKESDLYPMLNLNPKVSNYPLPRRFQVTQPTVDDKMGRYQEKSISRSRIFLWSGTYNTKYRTSLV